MLISLHFRLSEQDIEELDDERYLDLAAQAYFLEERETELVKLGVIKAIGEVFRKR